MQANDKEKLKLLGKRLLSLRKAKNVSRENLCYKNFLDPSNLAKYEKGQVEPKYLTLLKIAKAFDMTLSELFDFDTDS